MTRKSNRIFFSCAAEFSKDFQCSIPILSREPSQNTPAIPPLTPDGRSMSGLPPREAVTLRGGETGIEYRAVFQVTTELAGWEMQLPQQNDGRNY
jgi:hypothetical protein